MSMEKKLLDQLYKESNPVLDALPDYRHPTASPSVNWALQGGLVPGRFYCFFGPESAGKTMFAFSCCAEILKRNKNGIIIWFDVEKSLNDHWLKVFMSDEKGFTEEDRRRLVRIEATYGREIFDVFVEKLVTKYHDAGLPILACVLDSIQSIISPLEESRTSTEDGLMAALSQYLPRGMKAIIKPSRDRNISWIFLAQVRDVFDPLQQRMGKKYHLTGGKAIAHYIDALLQFEPMEGKSNKVFDEKKVGMDNNPIQVGHNIKMKVLAKCRVGIPNRVASFTFLYNEGIVNQSEEIIKLAINQEVIRLEGKTYFYGDQKLAVGMTELSKKILVDEQFQKELYEKVLEVDRELFSSRGFAPKDNQSSDSEEAV